MKKIIDLHLHSTASDGSLAPAKLMEAAAQAGACAVALTDHDTTAGLCEAKARAEELGMEFIPGVELSCHTECGPLDMLGYYVPLPGTELSGAFEARLASLRQARERRNAVILEKLGELGLPLGQDELLAEGESSVGRPHIAALMTKKGYVGSTREAFDRFLGAGRPAYVPKERFLPEEAVRLLISVGAVPIIAHPLLIHAPWEWLEATVAALAPQGLAGLEAYHSEHDARGVRNIVRLADKYGLMVSGGSDFHGAAKPKIFIGRGKGSLVVPHFVLEKLGAWRGR